MSAADTSVLDAITSVVPLTELPRLLWWVGTVRAPALWRLEELGCALGDAMSAEIGDFNDELTHWIEALRVAKRKFEESGDELAPRGVWAFWLLFTRDGEKPSPLTVLLERVVGYPADDEVRFSVSTGGAGDG